MVNYNAFRIQTHPTIGLCHLTILVVQMPYFETGPCLRFSMIVRPLDAATDVLRRSIIVLG